MASLICLAPELAPQLGWMETVRSGWVTLSPLYSLVLQSHFLLLGTLSNKVVVHDLVTILAKNGQTSEDLFRPLKTEN